MELTLLRSKACYAGKALTCVFVTLTLLVARPAAAAIANVAAKERLVEWTFESTKSYQDPFNDVDVDVIFSKAALQQC